MKMKKGLLMVVFLLAMSSIMAAMSYSSAKVTSAMTGSVTNTHESLLALSLPEPGHAASKLEDGVLKIDFSHGTKFGMQKNSEYTWNNLFLVKNNSENNVTVTINTEEKLPEGVKLFVRTGATENWTEINKETVAKFEGFNTTNNTRRNVSVKVEVSDKAQIKKFTPNIVVSGADAR
ncbi:hypothetical protein AB1K89_09270 [Sporosarcina sp. 179-K 8C2 HS]|uniref:hypothetical protein n=1 Tax=Sporosarcina sp. 179-K 8C2 HS TaxID=3142387 RepID=UPI0039A34C8E